MLRIIVATCLISVSSACYAEVVQYAQVITEVKPSKFGGGCEQRATPIEPRFGTCMLSESKARIWCPNGKVYERTGPQVQPALARSICGLNQVL